MRLRPSEDLAAAFAPVRRPASPEATGTDRGGTRARPYPPLPTSGAVATGRLHLCRRLLSLCSRPTIGTSRVFSVECCSAGTLRVEKSVPDPSATIHTLYREQERRKRILGWRRTQKDPFEGEWEQILSWLIANPERSSGDIFRELHRLSPGRYQPLHIRTLQRGMRKIRTYLLETFEEQWQEEVIRGPSLVPISPTERATRICYLPTEQTTMEDFSWYHALLSPPTCCDCLD